MQGLKKGNPDRSKINIHEPHEVHYWTKHLGVSKEQLQNAVAKVGNGAAAVKKELSPESPVRVVNGARYTGDLGSRARALKRSAPKGED